MDVHELRHLASIQDSQTKRIYNPDVEDFTVKWHGEPYTIKAMEIQEYPFHVANHLQKHLADKLLHKRGIKNSAEQDLKEIFKEIEVVL